MIVRFWGTRGSIATPGPHTTRYGGNTSCVEVRCGNEILIFDAGTGIRELGLSLMEEFRGGPMTLHLFISHTHWDHIQGFPFFMPAYLPTTLVHVYGSTGQGRPLEKLLRGQMDADYFPVALGDLSSQIQVHEFRGRDFRIGTATVSAFYLNHPGMNLGYRVTHEGRTVVYATDHEPYSFTLEHIGQRAEAGKDYGQKLDDEFVRFVASADLYIGEAQYTEEEYPSKIGWGHSSVRSTVEVALKANVKALALFHHDPMHGDDTVAAMVADAEKVIAERHSALRCFGATEGETLEV
jgi:phosphoribosyl 1,2-cyclic phosphodiesterase